MNEHVENKTNNNTLIYDDMKNGSKRCILSGNVSTENNNGLKDGKVTTSNSKLE